MNDARHRFVLRRRKAGDIDPKELHVVREAVEVVDETPRMLLIDCREDEAAALLEQLDEWVLLPYLERSYRIANSPTPSGHRLGRDTASTGSEAEPRDGVEPRGS